VLVVHGFDDDSGGRDLRRLFRSPVQHIRQKAFAKSSTLKRLIHRKKPALASI
jgi:hypothetical protein